MKIILKKKFRKDCFGLLYQLLVQVLISSPSEVFGLSLYVCTITIYLHIYVPCIIYVGMYAPLYMSRN